MKQSMTSKNEQPSYIECRNFIAAVRSLKSDGLDEPEIASAMGCFQDNGNRPSVTALRHRLSFYKTVCAKVLRNNGKTNREIANELGLSEVEANRLLKD